MSIDRRKIGFSIIVLILVSSIITVGFAFTSSAFGISTNQTSSGSTNSSHTSSANIQSSKSIRNNLGSIYGTITIQTISTSLVPGATYVISPNPKTGSGNLTVTDGGTGDEDGLANAIIKISQVPKGKYVITQQSIPSGFFSLLKTTTKNVYKSHLDTTAKFRVVPKSTDLTQLPPTPISSPSLNDSAFNKWNISYSAKIVSNSNSSAVTNVDQTPSIIVAGSGNPGAINASVNSMPSVLINTSFDTSTNGSAVINTIGLENYSLPNSTSVTTIIPTIVANVSSTSGYILSTPPMSGVIPGQSMVISVADPLIPSSGGLKAISVKSSNAHNTAGLKNENWFVALVQDKLPPKMSSNGIKGTPIFFINVKHPYEENKTGFNWSNPSNLASPPTLTIIVPKTSSNLIHQDSAGCPVVNGYTLVSGSWTTSGISEISSKSISKSKCEIIIQSQHLSKFAFSLDHLSSLVVGTFSTISNVIAPAPQSTHLTLNSITQIPWTTNVIVSGKLSVASSGTGLGGKTITFSGTGATGLSSVITKPDGTFSISGLSSNKVGTGWQINANFAGDISYGKSSTTQSYNTLAHSTSLTLTISPSSVVAGGTYSVSGTLTDTTVGKPLSAMTISFGTIISKTITSSTGIYTVTGLKAPTNTGSYQIQAQFGGTSLYSSVNSAVQILMKK